MSSRQGGARRTKATDEEGLRARLLQIEQQIARLNPRDPYLDELARYFPGGRVGGSGRHGTARHLQQFLESGDRHRLCGVEGHACLFDRPERALGASGG
jgi:hypothetical protein